MLALSQNAIVRCISFNKKPAVIPNWQIESLKKMLIENPEIFVSDKVKLGSKIKITEGPFSDIIGIVIEKQEDKWLAVNIDLIQRSVMVRLPLQSSYQIIDNI
jgi:transcription antitermination factor NusG